MDEAKILSLIAEGENERIEFKRELDLGTTRGKSEFIKDVISIANSASNSGYILVGVDDDKLIVGINALEEERIQQIAHTYITPSVVLRCSLVPMTTPSFSSVGVIEIKATNRPHKVARAISKLNQDDVFVRRGSVVSKASPEEIIRMRETRLYREARQYIRAAETHLRLENWQSAIDAYSEAIKINPTPELFLARGGIYLRLLSVEAEWSLEEKWADLALKDFSDAISLTEARELEKEARLGRLRACSIMGSGWGDTFLKDLEWLKANTQGREHGEVLYLEWRAVENEVGLSCKPNQAVVALDKAIQLGYNEPGAYHLRALANFYACNYGLALQDLDRAVEGTEQTSQPANYWCLRAYILVKMGKFEEAYTCLSKARQLSKGESCSELGYFIGGIEDEIVYRYSMAYELNALNQQSISRARAIFQILTVFGGEIVVPVSGKGQVILREARMDERYPTIAHVIRAIIGAEFLQKYKRYRVRGLQWVFDPPQGDQL